MPQGKTKKAGDVLDHLQASNIFKDMHAGRCTLQIVIRALRWTLIITNMVGHKQGKIEKTGASALFLYIKSNKHRCVGVPTNNIKFKSIENGRLEMGYFLELN